VLIVIGTNWLSWLLLMIAGMAGVEMILGRRAMQRQSAWALITGNLGGGEPSPAMLRRQQVLFTGIVGRAYRKFVTTLEQGVSLRKAISLNRDALPRWAQAYAAIGALKDPKAQPFGNQLYGGTSTLIWQPLFQRSSYLGMVLIIMFGLSAFLMIKIIPSYQAIFDDFELELPAITNSLMMFSSLLIDSHLIYLLLGCLVLTLLAIFLTVVLYLCDIPVLRPISDRLFFTQHRAFVLQLLAIAAEQGEPFVNTLGQLQPRYPSHYVGNRLWIVQKSIIAGCNWQEALCHGSIISRADFPMLETAQAAGNLPWVLRMLADQKMRSMIFRWSALEQVAYPCVIGLLGLLVMWICVAMFIPLVNLIIGLT